MARKRVIAYFMHEAEKDAVVNRLTAAEITESFAIGDMEEEDISELRNQGIIVQLQPSIPTTGEEPRSPAMSLSFAESSDV